MYWRAAPAGPARSCLVFVHGFGEHAGRYERIFAHFPRQHILAFDLRGHGRSAGQRGHVGRFVEYHSDLERALRLARAQAPGLPVILIAHSFGGLLAAHFCILKAGAGLRGLVLSSPAFRFCYRPPAWERAAAWLANLIWPRFTRPARLRTERLSHDPEVAARLREDPMSFSAASARWYHEALAAQQLVAARAGELHLDTCLLYSGNDALVDAEVTAEVAAHWLQAEVRVYPDCYHELFQETRAGEILRLVRERCEAWEKS